ncbi:MAG: hypothetical protein MUO72_11800 [Bacteroidales bacterium]|nr:hypothetical protein [Bacteroidales bacterium]
MKKYSYNLFPKPFIILGYILIFLAIAAVLISLNSTKNENHFNYFTASFAMMIIGLIMISFKSKLIVDDKSSFILKESSFLSMTLSKEKIRIPHNCNRILIKQKNKRGTGYYRFILPVTYNFKSFDMFFYSETGMVRLINTDYKRAIKIAEFLKSNFELEYIFEK